MRKMLWTAGSALALSACGGSGGGSGSAATATIAPAPTPTPTPTTAATSTGTPSPTPSPTATTASVYPRYSTPTADRTFDTACASLMLGGALPTPQPAASFGEALALGYSAAASGWNVSGDGVSLSFSASDAVAAPTGQKIYERAVAGATQRLTLTDPATSGTIAGYTRALTVRADRTNGPALYACVFGVPSLAADIPAAAVSYGRIAVTGTAYASDAGGTIRSYVLSADAGTLSYDPATKLVTVRMHLLGNLQTGSVVAAAGTDLGTYTGVTTLDTARVRFAGSLDGVDRVSLFSSFGGALFGGVEAGYAFEILAADTNTGSRVAVVGTLATIS